MPIELERHAGGRGRGRRHARRCSPTATATPRARCWRWPRSARAARSGSCPTCPTCWPRWSFAARLEQAQSLGDVLLRRTRLGLLAARALVEPRRRGAARASPRCSAASSAGTTRASTPSSRPWRRRRRRGHRPAGAGGGMILRSAAAARAPAGRAARDGHRQREPGVVLGRRALGGRSTRRSRARTSWSRRAPRLIDVGGESGVHRRAGGGRGRGERGAWCRWSSGWRPTA